jgi:hypothetical protein
MLHPQLRRWKVAASQAASAAETAQQQVSLLAAQLEEARGAGGQAGWLAGWRERPCRTGLQTPSLCPAPGLLHGQQPVLLPTC